MLAMMPCQRLCGRAMWTVAIFAALQKCKKRRVLEHLFRNMRRRKDHRNIGGVSSEFVRNCDVSDCE